MNYESGHEEYTRLIAQYRIALKTASDGCPVAAAELILLQRAIEIAAYRAFGLPDKFLSQLQPVPMA